MGPVGRKDADRAALADGYARVRRRTEALAAPLSPEDQQLQSMPDCSPTKWHRAHTTWFFETFLLGPRGVAPVHQDWGFLFNSYYEAIGPRHARPRRGMLSRPSCEEIAGYRRIVDGRMLELIGAADEASLAAMAPLIELGLAHEEQHQELLLTDALHALAQNPLAPAYRQAAPPAPPAIAAVSFGSAAGRQVARLRLAPGPPGSAAPPHSTPPAAPLSFTPFDGGLVEIGVDSGAPGAGFAFDNEGPRHKVWLEPFALADRLVTVGEVQAFAADGGYRTPSLWLSAGWEWLNANDVRAPGHVRLEGAAGAWRLFGLDGLREPDPAEPAAFLSYYEADAIARWLGARLPSEAEWELAARGRLVAGGGNCLADDPLAGSLRPLPSPGGPLAQLLGDAWEWTRSAYEPYPGFAPAGGAIGEYNGKFMVNQLVLRGGSCFTPPGHVRESYRNFWPPETRFQVTGVRLARPV